MMFFEGLWAQFLKGFEKMATDLDAFDRERERRHFYETAEEEIPTEWVFIGQNLEGEQMYQDRAVPFRYKIGNHIVEVDEDPGTI